MEGVCLWVTSDDDRSLALMTGDPIIAHATARSMLGIEVYSLGCACLETRPKAAARRGAVCDHCLVGLFHLDTHEKIRRKQIHVCC